MPPHRPPRPRHLAAPHVGSTPPELADHPARILGRLPPPGPLQMVEFADAIRRALTAEIRPLPRSPLILVRLLLLLLPLTPAPLPFCIRLALLIPPPPILHPRRIREQPPLLRPRTPRLLRLHAPSSIRPHQIIPRDIEHEIVRGDDPPRQLHDLPLRLLLHVLEPEADHVLQQQHALLQDAEAGEGRPVVGAYAPGGGEEDGEHLEAWGIRVLERAVHDLDDALRLRDGGDAVLIANAAAEGNAEGLVLEDILGFELTGVHVGNEIGGEGGGTLDAQEAQILVVVLAVGGNVVGAGGGREQAPIFLGGGDGAEGDAGLEDKGESVPAGASEGDIGRSGLLGLEHVCESVSHLWNSWRRDGTGLLRSGSPLAVFGRGPFEREASLSSGSFGSRSFGSDGWRIIGTTELFRIPESWWQLARDSHDLLGQRENILTVSLRRAKEKQSSHRTDQFFINPYVTGSPPGYDLFP